MTHHDSLAGLKSAQGIFLPYPSELRSAVERAVGSWKGFCALDESEKSKFPYISIDGLGVGYELKKKTGATSDDKEDFHANRQARIWLRDVARDIDNGEAQRFIEDTEKVIDLSDLLVGRFAEDVEEQFSLPGFASEVQAGKDRSLLRFLHYFGGRRPGEVTGAAHADKSGFTPTLYESDPGLQQLTLDGKWEPVSIPPGQSLVMAGMQLQYRSKGAVFATVHRIVATERTAIDGRYSSVCFVPLMCTPMYDKVKAGRTQDFPAGFNYTMPLEEFAKLFT
jgi:hypothetical protein